MLDNLEVDQTVLSVEQLDQLFKDVPDDVKDNTTPQNSSVDLPKDQKLTIESNATDIPFIDLDKLEEEKVEEEGEPKKEEETKQPEAQKEPEEEKKEDKEPEVTSEDEIKAINQVLKNSTNFLIEKGIFKDLKAVKT